MGGGGGQSGSVELPVVLKNVWADFICGGYVSDVPADRLGTSLVKRLNRGIDNPYTGETAYNPATRIANWETEIGVFETLVDALSETTDWAAILGQAVTTIDANWTAPTPAAAAEIAADVTAFEAIQDDRVEETVLPRFQRGMQDINAVMSSAFVIGQAIIEGMTDRDVAKYQGELRTKAFLLKDQLVADSLVKKNIAYTISAEQMVKYVGMMLGSNDSLARLTLDAEYRALEVERTEEENQLEIDGAEIAWPLELYQYGANLIASISGGVGVVQARRGPTKTQATIGGAASGAAMGSAVSPGWGTAIGAVVGAYLGYSQS